LCYFCCREFRDDEISEDRGIRCGAQPGDLKAFSEWFAEFEAERWDRQIEEDSASGKLDKLAEEALADHRAGRTRPL
jgi:hypothetical protein